MRLRKLLLLAIVFIAGISQAQMQMPPIPLDSAVRIGKLDNGLTYYIRYNNWPEHRANFAFPCNHKTCALLHHTSEKYESA